MTLFESLIAEFAEKTGQKIAPLPDGSVYLNADGVLITVQSREAEGEAVLFSLPVGDMKPNPTTMQKALELNAHGAGTNGFHLGISVDSFVLSCTIKLNDTSAEDLATKMLLLAATSEKVSLAMGAALAEYAENLAERESNGEDICNLSMLPV